MAKQALVLTTFGLLILCLIYPASTQLQATASPTSTAVQLPEYSVDDHTGFAIDPESSSLSLDKTARLLVQPVRQRALPSDEPLTSTETLPASSDEEVQSHVGTEDQKLVSRQVGSSTWNSDSHWPSSCKVDGEEWKPCSSAAHAESLTNAESHSASSDEEGPSHAGPEDHKLVGRQGGVIYWPSYCTSPAEEHIPCFPTNEKESEPLQRSSEHFLGSTYTEAKMQDTSKDYKFVSRQMDPAIPLLPPFMPGGVPIEDASTDYMLAGNHVPNHLEPPGVTGGLCQDPYFSAHHSKHCQMNLVSGTSEFLQTSRTLFSASTHEEDLDLSKDHILVGRETVDRRWVPMQCKDKNYREHHAAECRDGGSPYPGSRSLQTSPELFSASIPEEDQDLSKDYTPVNHHTVDQWHLPGYCSSPAWRDTAFCRGDGSLVKRKSLQASTSSSVRRQDILGKPFDPKECCQNAYCAACYLAYCNDLHPNQGVTGHLDVHDPPQILAQHKTRSDRRVNPLPSLIRDKPGSLDQSRVVTDQHATIVGETAGFLSWPSIRAKAENYYERHYNNGHNSIEQDPSQLSHSKPGPAKEQFTRCRPSEHGCSPYGPKPRPSQSTEARTFPQYDTPQFSRTSNVSQRQHGPLSAMVAGVFRFENCTAMTDTYKQRKCHTNHLAAIIIYSVISAFAVGLVIFGILKCSSCINRRRAVPMLTTTSIRLRSLNDDCSLPSYVGDSLSSKYDPSIAEKMEKKIRKQGGNKYRYTAIDGARDGWSTWIFHNVSIITPRVRHSEDC